MLSYPAEVYLTAPPVAAGTSTVKIVTFVIVAAIVGAVIFFGAIAIALGVGLGIGLRKSTDSTSSSTLSPPIVSCNSATATCGCPVNTPTFSSRIISGSTATSNSWPWMVALYMANGRVCSGFLITNIDVVTAANCVYGVSAANITAFVGITTLSTRSNGKSYGVALVTPSPTYTSSSYIDDIAVLRLSSAVTLSSTVGICCTTNDSSVPALGEHAVVAGWGETSSTTSRSNTLQQAVVQVVSPSTCGITTATASQFCANYGSVSTCPRDLGGPLMTSTNNAWTCSGLVSGGTAGCNSAGLYTRLSYYNAFILSAL